MCGLRPPVFSKGRQQDFMLAFAVAFGRSEGAPSNLHGATVREASHLRAEGGEGRLLHVK